MCVPYNPYLLKRYKAHINVECCALIDVIKYISKYIYKGQDRTTLKISDSRNEVEKYLHARYIGPSEAVWRLFEFPIHEEDPTVILLLIHLPDRQTIYFDPQASHGDIRDKLSDNKTMLMAWFEYNQRNVDGRSYLYQEFPEHFVFDNTNKVWKPRKKGFAIGRMFYINPICGEPYHLRLLLTVRRGIRSFDELRTVDGKLCSTFKEACLQLNLIETDDGWLNCFTEAALFATGSSLRSLFITALVYGQVSSPSSIWNRFCFELCDDLEHVLLQLLPNRANHFFDETESFHLGEPALDYGLFLINQELETLNMSLQDFADMPSSSFNWQDVLQDCNGSLNTFVQAAEQLDSEEAGELFSSNYQRLNQGQKDAIDCIISYLDGIKSNLVDKECFFVQGPAGTGKFI